MPTGTGGPPSTPAGGRGRGAARIDPRLVADYSEISAIPYTFSRHPMYPNAHMHMNSMCADVFLDIDDLFSDGATRSTFVDDPLTVIKNKIRDEVIIPCAVNTADGTTAISPLWA